MPVYQYITVDADKGCPVCRKGFDLRRPIDREPLEHCPLCRQPVRKLLSHFTTPKITKPVSVADAKKAGFTVLEKRDQGVYERL